MRSPRELRRARSARRTSALVLSLVLLTTLMGAVSGAQQASADDTADPAVRTSGSDRWSTVADPLLATPPGRRTARAAANPDQPTLPLSCRPPYGYMAPEPCRLVPLKRGAPLIVLWGDSHAWMMTPAIRRAVRHKRVNVVSLMQGSCPVMNSDLSTPKKYAARNSCDLFGHLALDFIDRARKHKRPLRVIVAMSWELYHNAIDPPNAADERYPGYVNDYIRLNARKGLNGTRRAFRTLARMGVRTDIVAPQPMIYETAPECPRGAFRCPLPRHGVLKDAAENNARIRELRSLLSKKGSVIRPARSLCTDTVCHGEIDGLPTYWDSLHIGQRVSYRLAPHFAPTVRAVLQEAKAGRRRR